MAEITSLRRSIPEKADEAELILAKLEEITDRIRRVQNSLGGVWADPRRAPGTEEDASRACSEYVNLFTGRHGWQTQLARAMDGEISAAKARRSLEKFRGDLNWRRQFAVERVLEVGMERRGGWACIKEREFQDNVDRLLELERKWAAPATALEAKLDEAERLLELMSAESESVGAASS
jgi:hypothetical protein